MSEDTPNSSSLDNKSSNPNLDGDQDNTKQTSKKKTLIEIFLEKLKTVPQKGEQTLGKLVRIIGPMFGGKSTELLGRLTRAHDVNLKVAYINHSDDIRVTKVFTENITTHSSGFKFLPKGVDQFKLKKLTPFNPKPYDLIGIDEAHFFEDLEPVVRRWKMDLGKHIIIVSLSGDFENNVFGGSYLLEPITDEVVIKKAYCKICLEERKTLVDASYSSRLASNTEQKLVGGEECYIPTCLSCWKRIEEVKPTKT